MDLPQTAQTEVAERLRSTAKEREETRDYVASGEILKANTPERIERRKVKLLADRAIVSQIGRDNASELTSGPVRAASLVARRAFERQIGGNETQPCWFLTRGTDLRRTVGRIHIRDAHRRVGWGTGCLVAPQLLLTNQHVLDSLETARQSRVEFDYEETYTGEFIGSASFDLDPDTFFVTHPAVGGLDYALVAVSPRSREDSARPGALLAEFGFNVLVREEGKLAIGELIHSIHHPEGQSRQVSLRENRLMAMLELWLHYETDTAVGSSGAPLFNNQWQLVGVHHAGVEKRDADGNILAIGGGRWTPDMGERQKWWHANEGLRLSRFVAHVERQVDEARDPAAPTVPERIVTDRGFALFQAMLGPSRSALPLPAVTARPDRPRPVIGPASSGRFRPE